MSVQLAENAQGALFDYETLDAENRIVVQQRTLEIHDLVRKTAESVVQIGAKLTEVQQRLGGRFTAWLDNEFSWSERTAYNYMAVWQKFGDQKSIAKIANSALYLLSASGTPEPARKAAIEMAEAGEPVTHKTAKVLVEMAKDAEPKTAEMFEEPEEALPDPEREQGENAGEDQKVPEVASEPEEPKSQQKSSVKDPVKPKSTAGGTDLFKFLQESAFQINVRLMPVDGDPRGRQAIIALSANDGQPVISSKRLPDSGQLWPGPIGEALASFIEAESKKIVKPATKKPAAKAAKKTK